MSLILAAAVLAGCSAPDCSFPVEEFKTAEGGKLHITMVSHGSLALSYKGYEIQVDPVGDNHGQMTDYSCFPKADLILVTHEHGDHLDSSLIGELSKEGTEIICNEASLEKIPGAVVMHNGEERTVGKGITVRAVPAYNTSEGHTKFHPEGHGNGYILTVGGLQVYIAGDTEDIPEMSELNGIDIAFLPVNQPYTMTVEQCIRAAGMISPVVLIPYHLGDTDMQAIKDGLAGSGIDVRLFETLR